MTSNDIIEFWFSEIDKSKWFAKDEIFDQDIRSRFSEIHVKAARGELWTWRSGALGSLAEIIVLDQFSRNMYRGKPESFLFDPLALALSQFSISNGFDSELSAEQRSFLYMPFMHSESPIVHVEAVTLFTKLGIKSNLDFELRHKAIIDKFGRYPHRNEVLGRKSTPAEKAFLLKPGSGF
ncbi:DUF924 family protein [Teredinibacter waterburyi]|uniref:DUF924 family protein n=1 Tax=Teredinibacter waterburyi TaxID=1500538 RepID=UPI00165F09AE|nr:DUF924 family protein [Teredinibacter waterburyi]